MGWRAEDRMPELFAKAVQGMKAGEISAVLRSPGGFHVIKLVERRGAAEGAPVQQTRARHILVRTNEVISEAEARRRLADLRERIVTGGADFAELARLHSADGSASRGGDLDWLLPGDTVPDFERAMDALKPGEISQPVKSPFGLHLIQVHGAARRRAHAGAQAHAGAPDHQGAQGGRGLPGLAAPAARPHLRRNAPGRQVKPRKRMH